MSLHEHSGRAETAREQRRWLTVVLVVFAVSRVFFYALGLRFNAEGLAWYWQILDPELLRSNPFDCLVWMHAQPPLFNLGLGIVLFSVSQGAVVVFHGAYLVMGSMLAAVAYLMLGELGWPARSAAMAVTVAMLTPGWLMYESWLFYDFPTAFLLVLAAFSLVRCGRASSGPWLAVFIWSVCGLALMRSLFHLVWLVAVLGIVALCRVRPRGRWMVAVLVPLIVVGALYLKNLVVFGVFGPSSWLGMSLAKMTTARLDPDVRERLVNEGVLSPYVLVPPFSPLEAYETAAGKDFLDPVEPMVGRRLKSSGHPNFNHLAFVTISRTIKQDALAVVRTRPEVYAEAVATAWRRFFSPVIAYPPFADNLLAIVPLFRLSQATIGRPAFAWASYLAALVVAVLGWWRARAAGDRGLEAGAAFVLLTLLWVSVVGNLLEVGENHRFRFVVTPLVWFSLCAAVAPWLGKRRNFPPGEVLDS